MFAAAQVDRAAAVWAGDSRLCPAAVMANLADGSSVRIMRTGLGQLLDDGIGQ